MQPDETIHHRILFREDGVGTAASQLRSQFKYQFCSGDGISCGSRGEGITFYPKRSPALSDDQTTDTERWIEETGEIRPGRRFPIISIVLVNRPKEEWCQLAIDLAGLRESAIQFRLGQRTS